MEQQQIQDKQSSSCKRDRSAAFGKTDYTPIPTKIEGMDETGMCSIRGARLHENEDREFVWKWTGEDGCVWVVMGVFDGHGGNQTSNYWNKCFQQELLKLLSETALVEHTLEQMKSLLLDAFETTLERFDEADQDGFEFQGSGTCVSVGLWNESKRRYAGLQLGDSATIVVDVNRMKLAIDSKGKPLIPIRHSWDPEECKRTLNVLKKEGYENALVLAGLKNNTLPLEDRTQATIYCGAGVVYVPVEPSRTVESKGQFDRQRQRLPRKLVAALKKAQRTPDVCGCEFGHYPEGESLLMCGVCDGFLSKKAVPTDDDVAHLMVDPSHYVHCERFWEGTVFEHYCQKQGDEFWNQSGINKPESAKFGDDPMGNLHRISRELLKGTDQHWLEAVDKALGVMKRLFNTARENCDRLSLAERAEIATAFAVLMLSDDNVTLVVAKLANKAPQEPVACSPTACSWEPSSH